MYTHILILFNRIVNKIFSIDYSSPAFDGCQMQDYCNLRLNACHFVAIILNSNI